MTGTDIAVRDERPLAVTLSNDQLKYISGTEFVPKGLRNNLPAILACVATGRAIGVDDMTAIRSIHIIDGKPTFSAELMVMLVRRRGHSIAGEVGPESATVIGKRADNGDTMTVTWTLDMAKRAGLLGKGNWKNYPEAMLWARAVSQLCRMLFADCFAGATYTTEELGEEHTDAAGEPFDEEPFEDDGLFPPPGEELISEKQRTLLWATAGDALVEEDELRAIVRDITGQESTKQIRASQFSEVLEGVRTLRKPPGPDAEVEALIRTLRACAAGRPAKTLEAMERLIAEKASMPRARYVAWLQAQIERARSAEGAAA